LSNVDVNGGSISSSSRLSVNRGVASHRDLSPRNVEPRQNGYEPSKSNARTRVIQVSISPTFYEQLLCQNPFTKKLQTQIVST
jgi:hypothetical protein